jgi:hypothetical protein
VSSIVLISFVLASPFQRSWTASSKLDRQKVSPQFCGTPSLGLQIIWSWTGIVEIIFDMLHSLLKLWSPTDIRIRLVHKALQPEDCSKVLPAGPLTGNKGCSYLSLLITVLFGYILEVITRQILHSAKTFYATAFAIQLRSALRIEQKFTSW